MKVAFRADASLQMGSGHVMRCLTLAQALAAKGAECHFICREHPGNLIDMINSKGFKIHTLPVLDTETNESQPAHGQALAHSHWLGASQLQDAAQTSFIIQSMDLDWLVVDHYALDATWEETLKPFYKRLMVIDDLADRKHVCDLLLDQNLGREAHHYAELVPEACSLMIGPKFALLRPEFAELREYSLKRRSSGELKHILITMGGVDSPNATGQILSELKRCALPENSSVTVVLGESAPWLDKVGQEAALVPWATEVLVNINDMAVRMSNADLCIGAAGGTAWERCCLGLPSFIVAIAENQMSGATALESNGAGKVIGVLGALRLSEYLSSTQHSNELSKMSVKCREIADGLGCSRVVHALGALDD